LAADLHIFKSCRKFRSTVDPEMSVYSANSVTFHHLFSSMHCSLMANDTLSLLNACTHLVTLRNGRAWLPKASCSCAWLFCSFLLWESYVFTYKCCSTLWASSFECHQHNSVCTWTACTPLYIYLHLMVTFMRICLVLSYVYTYFCIALFFGKKKVAVTYGVTLIHDLKENFINLTLSSNMFP
jgi:hypothetical protein